VNVITPLEQTEPLPVLVFIHGGNFKQGYNGGGIYDFAALANQTNTVVVIPQYRLGSFGFLHAAQAGLSGNYGVLDQRQALQWVQTNAAAFGGDPSRVTIAGQSAGGCSVVVALVDQNARGLFHQAIVESASCLSLPLRSAKEAQWLGDAFMKDIQCQDVACLRRAPAEQVLQAQLTSANQLWSDRRHLLELFQPFEPTYGTADTSLTMQPLEHIRQGDWAAVPVLAGTVTDEAVPFVYAAFTKAMSGSEALALLDVVFGPQHMQAALDWYPISKDDVDARESLITLVTDFLFTCATRNFTQTVAAQMDPAYSYRYAHVSPEGEQVWGANYTFCWHRCCHAAEIPIAYATAALLAPPSEDELVFIKQVSSYWGNFVHSGNPNSASLPVWPRQDPTLAVDLYMDTNMLFPDHVARTKFCDYWDSVGYETY
jgi:carboxylesterase type B